MKILLALILIALVSVSQAEAVRINVRNANATQEIAISLPSRINLNLGGKLDIINQQDQTNSNQEANKWTDPITLLTIGLVISNILLWLTTRTAANAARDGIELARKEFIAAYPPKLIIRRIRHKEIKGNGGASDAPAIEFEIANVGGSDAINVGLNARVWLELLPPDIPYNEHSQAIPDTLARAGVSSSITHIVTEDITTFHWNIAASDPTIIANIDETHAYFLGYITYESQIGIKRRMAFCRIYDGERKRFVKMGSPDEDYEYAE